MSNVFSVVQMVTTRRNSDDDVPNFEAMISAVVANALPNLTAALRTQNSPGATRIWCLNLQVVAVVVVMRHPRDSCLDRNVCVNSL
ncbi:hypothetical protein Tco_1202028 [Tanacetum coccineum]